MSQNWIDGNAMAGPLRDLFTVELTAAVGTCASCEARAALAEAVVFDRARPAWWHGAPAAVRCSWGW